MPEPASLAIVLPAYNEAKVIAPSITQILNSTHATLEVIVIDDGSSDGTSDVVRAEFGAEPRVKLITTTNGGKARAVNIGLENSHGEVVVALDADTHFEPDTIAELARWFGDEKIGAVAGNAKVGNRINLLTRWQALEYITAQNLERRALAAREDRDVAGRGSMTAARHRAVHRGRACGRDPAEFRIIGVGGVRGREQLDRRRSRIDGLAELHERQIVDPRDDQRPQRPGQFERRHFAVGDHTAAGG